MIRFSFSSKLLFLFGLTLFAVFLIPASVQGQRVCAYTPDANGGDYCQTRTGNFPGTLLESHEVCLPWQTAKIGQIYTFEKVTSCYFDECVVHPPYIKKVGGKPRYYDNPSYPTDPFAPEEGIASNNITLPVKFDWDEVEGWKDGWMEQEWKDGRMQKTLKTCLARYDPETKKTIPGAFEYRCEEIGRESVCLSACNYQCDEEQTKTEKTQCEQAQSPSCIRDYWVDECKTSYPQKCQDSINFYQIKITGEVRDAGALAEIDELEEKIKLETDPEKSTEYLEEIERIRKEELEISEYKAFSDKSEFIPPSCVLKSGRNYTWQVRGCGGQNEATCGPWGDAWSFSTSLAPEPYYPPDPDWGGPGLIENLNQKESEKLNWCELESSAIYKETITEGKKVYRPLAYKVLLYYSEDDLCHEQLFFNGKCLPKILAPDENVFSREKLPPDEFANEGLFFTKKTVYAWKVSACKDVSALECTDYSQLWRFGTGNWDLEVNLVNPPNDEGALIGLPVTLTWSSSDANSYNYELYGVSSGKNRTTNITFDYPQISPNTVYKWRVQACKDYESKECDDSWWGPWYFKTTGQPPIIDYPSGNNIPIPIEFKWQAVPEAKSYVFKIQGEFNKEITTEEQKVVLDYPDLKQETNYSWQVKTCAGVKGGACGNWSSPRQFKTFKVSVPEISYPKNNESFFTYQKNYVIDWEEAEGADFYEYEVNFVRVSPEETNSACQPENIIPKTIIGETNSGNLKLVCLGDYQWEIRSCLDESCQEAGDWSPEYNFSFVQKEKPTNTGGLVPCGKTEDNPDTKSWNEKEDCDVRHIFLLIRNVIDFVLWTVAPILLALLVMGTALMFYLSVRFQDGLFLTRIKLIWKSAGIGFGVLFLSWIALNIFLSLIGFKIGIFGAWWQVGF